MKSKNALLGFALAIALSLFATLFFIRGPVFFAKALPEEWLENRLPTNLDEETVLPFGYTLGPWPKDFAGEPIVTKLTYQKGPPQKFIQKLTQIWKPIEVELEIEGPITIIAGMSATKWKNCFASAFLCNQEKKNYSKVIFPDLEKHSKDEIQATWFDSLDPLGPRGTHVEIKAKTYQIDRYTLITESGATQTFSLKSISNPTGLQARELFTKVLSSLKVKEDLQSSREWIQSKIKNVRLDDVRKIQSEKLRLLRLIQIQNWIYALLSVDPTQVAPFFHLAGVTHLLAMDLMKSTEKHFENQEAWILGFRPLFETLTAYAKDFPNSSAEVKNIEALLQDILYQQGKLSH